MDAFSKVLTYTELYSGLDAAQMKDLGEVITILPKQISSAHSMAVELKDNVAHLPRFTTQLNRAKKAALKAIDEYVRFTAASAALVTELKRNYDALVSGPSTSYGSD